MGMVKDDFNALDTGMTINKLFDNLNYLFTRVITLLSFVVIYTSLNGLNTFDQLNKVHNETLENQITVIQQYKSHDYSYKTPEAIYFPTEGNKIRIEHTFIDTNTFYTSDETANYVKIDNSSLNKDVIFAHARKKLFADIADLDTNVLFYIKNDDKINVYELYRTRTVRDDDFDLLTAPGFEELEIFTCVGDDDEFRQLLSAKLVNSYSIGKKGEI